MKNYFERKKTIGFFYPTLHQAQEAFHDFVTSKAVLFGKCHGLEVTGDDERVYRFFSIDKNNVISYGGLTFYQVHISPSVDTDLYSFIYSRVSLSANQ